MRVPRENGRLVPPSQYPHTIQYGMIIGARHRFNKIIQLLVTTSRGRYPNGAGRVRILNSKLKFDHLTFASEWKLLWKCFSFNLWCDFFFFFEIR